MTKKKPIICANCGIECETEYVRVLDNYLIVNYFDSNEDNVFCNNDCLAEALSAKTFFIEEDEDELLEEDYNPFLIDEEDEVDLYF